MKPILIDAVRINMGGGLSILNHLTSALALRGIEYVLLKDSRCPKLDEEDSASKVIVIKAGSKKYRDFFKNSKGEFHSVLCLGNVPPPIRLKCKVYTYFHNVSFLKIPKDYSFYRRILCRLKKIYIKFFEKNTDYWIVQTSYTRDLVRENLAGENTWVLVYPFYYIPSGINLIEWNDRNDYVYVGEYTNAKGQDYLVDAWVKLHELGVNRTLHLTVTDPDFCIFLESVVNKGVSIINHGHISFEEVVKLYNKSKAIIYPSLNESLGLGIVEAIEAGCDVIGVDLPYMHSVCLPSVTFKACDVESIVESVLFYEKSAPKRTELRVRDMADDLITLLLE